MLDTAQHPYLPFLLRSFAGCRAALHSAFQRLPSRNPPLCRVSLFTCAGMVFNWFLISSAFAGFIFKSISLLNQNIRQDRAQCPMEARVRSECCLLLAWRAEGHPSGRESPPLHSQAPCLPPAQTHRAAEAPGRCSFILMGLSLMGSVHPATALLPSPVLRLLK